MGADSVGLEADGGAASGQQRLVVYVPFTVEDQPRSAVLAIKDWAREVVEIGLPKGKHACLARNDAMIDGANRLIVFSDGSKRGGSRCTWQATVRSSLSVEVILVRGARREAP